MGKQSRTKRESRDRKMNDRRYFVIPEPVIAVNKITGEPLQRADPDWVPDEDDPRARPGSVDDIPWTLGRYLLHWVVSRPDWQKGVSNQRMAFVILDTVEGASTGDPVSVPAKAWSRLVETFESDEFDVSWPLGPQLVHFADLIIDASDKPCVDGQGDEAQEADEV